MTNRTPANSNAMAKGPEVIDAQVIDINPAPMQRGGSIQMAPRNTMRSNIQDGGWFDATQGKRKPVFVISPTTDPWSIFPVLRSGLSCLRGYLESIN